ncbi:hypothetical protein BH10ACT1_BH10ACT1_10280 [soil metagenome]
MTSPTPSSPSPATSRLRAARCLAVAIAVATLGVSIAFLFAPGFSATNIAVYTPRNTHLLADIGAFQLAIAVALAGWAWRPDQWLGLWVALASQSVHALIHLRDDVLGTAVAGSNGFASAAPNVLSWALVAGVVVLAGPRRKADA